jgi:hypothetical protein
MIIHNKIELDFDDKLKFFKVPIILFLVSAFCIFYGCSNISNYSINELNNTSNQIGILLLFLALILLIKQKNNLKFIEVNRIIDVDFFKQKLCEFVKTNKWKIDFPSKNHAVIKTDSAGSYSRYFLAKSYGEIIHIQIAENKIYFKSIFDVNKNTSITISTGENKSNEKIIEKLITSLDKRNT